MASDIDIAILLTSSCDDTPYDSKAHKLDLDDAKLKKIAKSLDYGNVRIENVFNLARHFVNSKDGSNDIQMSYDDRNMMNVLCKQAKYSKFDPDAIQVGFLDLIGQDRLRLWRSLGHLEKEEAMNRYINLVVKVCPLFIVHFEAQKLDLEKQESLIREKEMNKPCMVENSKEKKRENDLAMRKTEKEELQEKQIKEALSQQTYPYFKAYAEKQNPNDDKAQENLIKELLEQHFVQYMSLVNQQQQLIHQQ